MTWSEGMHHHKAPKYYQGIQGMEKCPIQFESDIISSFLLTEAMSEWLIATVIFCNQ